MAAHIMRSPVLPSDNCDTTIGTIPEHTHATHFGVLIAPYKLDYYF